MARTGEGGSSRARDGHFRRRARGDRGAVAGRPAASTQAAARGGRGARKEGTRESLVARSSRPATPIDSIGTTATAQQRRSVKPRLSSSSPTKGLSDGQAISPLHDRRRMDPRNSWLNLDVGSDSFLASMGFEPFARSSNLGASQTTPNSEHAALVDSSMDYEADGGPSTQAYAGENTHAPTSQVPIELDQRPTKTAARATRAKKTKRPAVRVKGSNFSAAEDLLIVKGWLEVSKDAVINTNQKGSTFWDRILEHYNARRGDLAPRTYRSLQSRWDVIKEYVGKFIGYVTQVERANPSGYTDANKISMAIAAYNSIEKCPFQLMHCYEIMKDEPKWMDSKHNKGPSQADVDVYSQFTPNQEHDVENSGEDSSPTPSLARGKRPMGREASKNKSRKTSSSSSAASEFVGHLQVLSLDKEKYWKQESERRTAEHNDFLMLEREKLALQRQAEERQAQLMQRAEDERILGMDLEKCPTEALRTYYATLQQEILERIKQAAANRGK